MKNQIIVTATAMAMVFGTAFLIGCGSGNDQHHHATDTEHHGMHNDADDMHHAHAKYQCPMDCEEGKTYDSPGTCPVCNMDLEEVSTTSSKESETPHHHDHVFACPMHPEITGHKGDSCSKCGMALEEVKEDEQD